MYEGKGTQNLQNLSEGTYIAKVKMDNGVRTIKFIKKYRDLKFSFFIQKDTPYGKKQSVS